MNHLNYESLWIMDPYKPYESRVIPSSLYESHEFFNQVFLIDLVLWVMSFSESRVFMNQVILSVFWIIWIIRIIWVSVIILMNHTNHESFCPNSLWIVWISRIFISQVLSFILDFSELWVFMNHESLQTIWIMSHSVIIFMNLLNHTSLYQSGFIFYHLFNYL